MIFDLFELLDSLEKRLLNEAHHDAAGPAVLFDRQPPSIGALIWTILPIATSKQVRGFANEDELRARPDARCPAIRQGTAACSTRARFWTDPNGSDRQCSDGGFSAPRRIGLDPVVSPAASA